MRNFISKYKLEVIIFLIALIARLLFFFVSFHAHGFDLVSTIKGDDGYYEISQNLLHGHGFSYMTVPPYMPNPLRPPVWPFMIAGLAYVFQSYWAVFVFEIMIGSLIPVLGMVIVRKLFDKKAIWFGTGIALALEPYGVFLSTVLYTETMFTFLFLIFFWFLIRYFEDKSMRSLVWMTMFMALATLVKPTIQYVPLLLSLLILWDARQAFSRKVVGHILVLLVVFGAAISPWIYRNYAEWGVVGMSAQPAYNLYIYLVPTVLAIDNHTDFQTEYQAFVMKKGFDENDITLATSKYYSDKALAVIGQHKLALVKSVGATLVTFFTHDGMLTFLQYEGWTTSNSLGQPVLSLLLRSPAKLSALIGSYARSPGILILVVRLFWIIAMIFLFIGIVVCLKREERKPAIVSALLLVAYFALTTAINGLGVNARFRVPVNTFIFAFALYGFLVALKGIRHRFQHNRLHV